MVTLEYLLTQPEVELNGTLNSNKKKYKAGPLILNIFNLLPKNSMKKKFQKNPTSFGSSMKALGYQ